MRIFFIASRQLFRDKTAFFTVFIQLILSMLLVSATASFATQMIDLQTIFQAQKLKQFSLYCPEKSVIQSNLFKTLTFEKQTKDLLALDANAQWGVLGKTNLSDFQTKDGFSECYFMNQVLVEHISLPLQAGQWLDTREEDGLTAVVSSDLASRLELGKQYTVAITDGSHRQDIAVRIIGVLDSDNRMLSLTGSKAESLFASDISGMAVYLPDPAQIKVGMSFFNFLVKGYTSDNVAGTRYAVEDLITAYQEENKLLFGVVTIFSIMSVSLSLAGIGASAALKSKRESKRYALYYSCGAAWHTCLEIELIKLLFTFLLTVLPVLLVYMVFYTFLSKICSIGSFLTGIGVALCIYLPSAVWKMVSIYKK